MLVKNQNTAYLIKVATVKIYKMDAQAFYAKV